MTAIVSQLPAAGIDSSTADDLLLTPLAENDKLGIGLGEVLRISFASLTANKMRSLLTMLGIIIGVASVVALVAIGNGASASITSQVQSTGTNLLTISPGAPGRGGPGGPGNATQSQNLTLDDATAIKDLGLPVNDVVPLYDNNSQVVATAADKNANIMGTTAGYLTINNLKLSSGAFFTANDVTSSQPVVVLGANLATTLFGSGQAVGETVHIAGQPLTVIGVLTASGGSGFGSNDDRAFVPISVAQQRLFGARTPDGNGYQVSDISVSVTNAADITAVTNRMAVLLRERHHLKQDGTADDFQVRNQAALLSTLSSVTTLLTEFLAAIAGISLLVGGIGIMNIMLVSVTERTREIGLRKAVGARGQDVLLQFLTEALLLSIIGGLVGVGLGAAIATGVTLSGLFKTVITADAVLMSLGFSLLVGIFFGFYPARQAAQLNPIDALRYE